MKAMSCSQIANGARVCDPQPRRPFERLRFTRGFLGVGILLRLKEPRSDNGNTF
jgi:hypothetical protein